MKCLCVLATVSLLAIYEVVAANLGNNGSFDGSSISPGVYQTLSSIPGWMTTFGPGPEVQHDVGGSPFLGQQLLELDSSANSGIKQEIATTPGQQYVFSFA